MGSKTQRRLRQVRQIIDRLLATQELEPGLVESIEKGVKELEHGCATGNEKKLERAIDRLAREVLRLYNSGGLD